MADIYDPGFVKGVFDRCSERYIAFSLIFSFGFTERWRRQCVEAMPAPSAEGARGYDLMAGTGEVWPHLLKRFDGITAITAVDISSGMHRRAMARLHAHRAHRIDFIEDDLLASDLPPESADFVISTFGLKTFNPAQHARLAALVARVLKPGGVFSMIEASDPKGWWLRPLYLLHLKTVLPLIERLFLRGAQDFAMIGTYSTNFGDASGLARLLRDQGLEVRFSKYFFGCATGVAGRKV
ncbi:class I SAM-dependent methyltransferase [Bradyrhizobium aeschynomenes]|uniref:class I SAM-dependent methyltransferase n=1 Tax=Bradyrhizobium aeschynomenes TaxID=2734909 RepID=UPI00155510D5|nr:class I SAM-dependent methyltransferase [Bradyrhizobium aeschynomenes]NPV25808.1 class I SAM-dependent methyltransferase [Bradyrhizobium aeschynomenes]